MPIALAVIVCFIIWSALALRDQVNRGAIASVLAMSGARHIVFGALHGGDDGWTLEDVHLQDPSGRVAVDAPEATLALDWHGVRPFVTLTFDRPRVQLAVDDAVSVASIARGALHAPPMGRGMHVAFANGSVRIVGLRAEPILIGAVAGTIDDAWAHLTYSIRGTLEEGGRSYPVAGTAAPEGPSIVHHWEAAALPAPLLSALVHSNGFDVRSGALRDINLRFVEGGALRGDAKLVDATISVDGHVLHGLTTALAVDKGEVAARDARAALADVQVTASGVTRFGDFVLWRELFDRIANERGLQSVRLETVAPGVAFAKYIMRTDDGPLAVSLLDVDPQEPTVRFDTVLAGDRIFSGAERTSSMAVRTGAVAGIDGDYFDMGGTSAPQGLMIRDGRLLHSPDEVRETLVVGRDKSFTFGLYRFGGEVRTPRGVAQITMFNDWPPGKVAIVTPDLGRMPATPNVTFVALSPTATPHRFRVDDVAPLDSRRTATFGLAFGPLASAKVPRRGDAVDVEYHVTPSIDDAVAAVASGPLLLKDGKWYEDSHAPAPGERDVRWPVVGVGKLPSGRLLWAAVDGRWFDVSIGMTRPEFAALLQRFGVRDAIALDSGGSVTMVSRIPGDDEATVRNHPSDSGGERWVANGLFIYSSAHDSALADVLRVKDLSQARSVRDF